MPSNLIPVVLVHGWKSHPGIWNRLTPRLNEEDISFWSFDYTSLNGASMEEIAGALRDYTATQRDVQGYAGSIDVVCHSIGSCIARYLLEVLDGSARHEQVRQLIAIGPPNNGSSLAELFCDPVIGRGITGRLCGTFVPRNFRSGSRCHRPGLSAGKHNHGRSAEGRHPSRYQVPGPSARKTSPVHPHSFPALMERPVNCSRTAARRMTYAGDGIVPLADSVLPGAVIEVLPVDPATFDGDAAQDRHIRAALGTRSRGPGRGVPAPRARQYGMMCSGTSLCLVVERHKRDADQVERGCRVPQVRFRLCQLQDPA